MTSFAFRLERLLGLRHALERERAADLQLARRREEAERESLETLRLRYEELQREASDLASTPTVAGTIRNYGLVLEAALQSAEAQQQHVIEAERLRLEKQTTFDAARVDRRSLERLRETAHEAWSREDRRLEQRTLDDTAMQRSAGAPHAEGSRP